MTFRNILKGSQEAAGSELWQKCLENLLLLLAPIAPHISEELWQKVKPGSGSIHLHSWPEYDQSMIFDDLVTLVVQVNGKVRERLEISPGINKEEAEKLAFSSPKVEALVDDKQIIKVIFVPEKLVNIVCR